MGVRSLPLLLLLACASEPATDPAPYPAGPYGTDVGAVVEDFELADCSDQTVRFGDVLAGAELVLLNVGAGWCQPCVEETRTLEAEVFGPFRGRGLAVVQVLFEDALARPATGFFCREWSENFGLTFPVLRDPLFLTGRFFDDAQAQTPLNLLVTPDGRIVARDVGGAAPGELVRLVEMHLGRGS